MLRLPTQFCDYSGDTNVHIGHLIQQFAQFPQIVRVPTHVGIDKFRFWMPFEYVVLFLYDLFPGCRIGIGPFSSGVGL